MTSHLYKNQTK